MFGKSNFQIAGGWYSLALIVVGLTLFRFWAAAKIGLAPDETYYWLWSRVPSAGYYDHPPMIAWWISASTQLLGDTPLGIRTFAVLSMLATTIAVYQTAMELGLEPMIAALSALWLNAMFLMGGIAVVSDVFRPRP